MTSHWIHLVRRKQEVTKPEQEELWGRMEEQGRAGIFGAFKLLVSKQTLVSRGVAGFAVCHFSAELNGRRRQARK